jgi:hypothetical protein
LALSIASAAPARELLFLWSTISEISSRLRFATRVSRSGSGVGVDGSIGVTLMSSPDRLRSCVPSASASRPRLHDSTRDAHTISADRSFDYSVVWCSRDENVGRSRASIAVASDSGHEFEFTNGLDRDYLIVERSIKTQAPIVGKQKKRTWHTCRSQQLHRARDVPLLSRMVATRFESQWQPMPAPRDRRKGGRVQSTGTAVLHGSFAAHAPDPRSRKRRTELAGR